MIYLVTLSLKFSDDKYVGLDIFSSLELDVTKYISSEPMVFKQHKIVIKKMMNDGIKVGYRNVPMYVPDEEIFHLWHSAG